MMHTFFKRFCKENDSVKIPSEKGISILEILIVVGVISFVCIPAIQLVYSLHSDYILDIVRGDPRYSSRQEILDIEYHGDGSIRSVFKKGGIWEIQSVGNTQLSNVSINENGLEQKTIGGIHTRQTCTDFDMGTQASSSPLTLPTLYLYTSDELGQSTSTKLTDVAFVGDSLFISADSASTSLPDIYTYNSDSNYIEMLKHTKPTLSIVRAEDTGPGISQIQPMGTYLLMANTGVKSQASVLRIDAGNGDGEGNVVGQLAEGISTRTDLIIPGSNSSTTPITRAILYADGKIIVGTEKSVLPEIFIFDASTSQSIGSIETGYGVNDILIANELLIVAGPRDPEIEVFDINTFLKVGEYDLQGGSGNAKVLNIFGDQLYIGRTKGGNEFEVLTIERMDSNPISPFLPRFVPFFNKKIQWSIDTLLRYEEYSMLFTADEYGEFQLYKNDLDNESGSGSSGETILQYKIDLPDRVSNAVCFKNSIWMTFKDTDTSTTFASPYRLGVLVF